MNRHARLHTRKAEPGAPTKGRRRRIKSTADGEEPNLPIKVSPKNTSQIAAIEPTVITHNLNSPPLAYFTNSLPSIDVERTLTRPNTSDGVIGNSSEAYQAARVLSRRHSFVDNNAGRPTHLQIPINNERRSTNVANYFPSVDSPKSDCSSSSSEPDDSNDGSYQTSVEVESQYPSPAFTSFSPTAAIQDSMSDLEAIFANEQLHRSPLSRQIPLAQSPMYEFDFVHSLEGPAPKSNSAAYVVDNTQASAKSSEASSSTLTQKQLLLLQHQQLTQQLSDLEQLERSAQDSIPTPNSTHSQTIPLHQQNFFDAYDFSTQLFNEERSRQQQQQAQHQQQLMAHQQQQKLILQQQALQTRTLLHHQQHHAQQLHQQQQAQQLLQLTSMQPITQSLSSLNKPHPPHSRSRSSTLPSLNMPYLSLSIAPDALNNPPVSRSRSNTLNSTFPLNLPAISTPTYTYPSQSLSSAYAAASFPSLLLQQHLPVGNGLGLVASPEQILFDAYQRRKSLAIASASTPSSSVASSTTSNSTRQSADSTDSSTLDFFSGNHFASSDKMQGLESTSIGTQWSEEEKREGINWLLL